MKVDYNDYIDHNSKLHLDDYLRWNNPPNEQAFALWIFKINNEEKRYLGTFLDATHYIKYIAYFNNILDIYLLDSINWSKS